MNKRFNKIFFGILFIISFTFAGTYLMWQFQAKRAISALGSDVLLSSDERVDLEEKVEQEGSRLVINKIGVNMPLIESESENALLYGAWRAPGTSTPDKGSNTAIFGHRYLNIPPSKNTLFRLNEVKVGDTFEVIWQDETYTYKITEKFVVEPNQMEVLDPTDKSVVTLITCTPLFTTKQRLVVRGELVSNN